MPAALSWSMSRWIVRTETSNSAASSPITRGGTRDEPRTTVERHRPNDDQRRNMAIGVHFKHRGFTPARYDETIGRLDVAVRATPLEGTITWPWKRTGRL